MTERWLPVLGYEGIYEVSSIGRVRGSRRQGAAGGVLSSHVERNGYVRVCLYNGARRAKWVHRLVLEAFVGAPTERRLIACHSNGVPTDNRVENLRWDTPAANYEDARRHGTAAVGERNPMTRVGSLERQQIAEMRSAGKLQREIAAALNISQQHVSALLQEIAK